MKSNVRYVGNIQDAKLMKEAICLIKEYFKEKDVRFIMMSPAYYYVLLLYSKYIIEKEGMDYSKIISGEVDDLVSILQERFSKCFPKLFVNNFRDCKLYEILKKLAFEDYEILAYRDRVLEAYLESDKKYLLISNRPSFRDNSYICYSNVDIYNVDMQERKRFILEILDEITGNKRNYYNSMSMDTKQYDSVIYLNDDLKFVGYKEYVYRKHHITSKDIFMVCRYSFISKYQGSFSEIGRIFIDKNKAYIDYPGSVALRTGESREKKVNIKDLSDVTDEDLKDVINDKKVIENVSVDISDIDFMNHGKRIGLTTYSKSNEERDRILRLIDCNNHIESRINELDEIISKQIDKMFVK